MGFDAGSITATLELKRGQFDQELNAARRDAADFARQTYTATLDVATAGLTRSLDESRARLDEFARINATAAVSVATAGATASVEAMRARLDELGAMRVTPAVDVNTAVAEAKIAELEARLAALEGRSTNVSIGVDSGAALIELARVDAAASALDGRNVKIDVDANTAGAVAGLESAGAAAGNADSGFSLFSLSALKVASIVGLLGPALGVAASALADLPALALAGAAAIGTLASAFHGVMDTMKAYGAAQDAAGSGAAQAARQQQQAAASIVAAQDQVTASGQRLGLAQAQAADAAISSAERVSNAVAGVATAEQNAAASIESALNQQITAEEALENAQRAEQTAQENLTQARKDAEAQLQSLTFATEDNALAQRAAQFGLTDALAKQQADTAKGVSAEQAAKDQLAVDQARQRIAELQDAGKRLAAQKAEADAVGVDGSKRVVTAQDQVAASVRRTADAQRGVEQAADRVTKAQVDGAASVARAEQSLADARRAQTMQQLTSDASLASARQGVVTAERALAAAQLASTQSSSAAATAAAKYAEALAKLSPNARSAVLAMIDLSASFHPIQQAVQDAFFEGMAVQIGHVKDLLPILGQGMVGIAGGLNGMVTGFIGVITSAQGMSQINTILQGTAGFIAAGRPGVEAFTQNFLTLASVGSQSLGGLATELNKSTAGFKTMIDQAAASGQLKTAFDGLSQVVGALLTMFTQLFGMGITLGAQLNGPLAGALLSLGNLLVALTPAIGDLGSMFLDLVATLSDALVPVIASLNPLLDQLTASFGTGLHVTVAVLTPVLTVLGTVLSFLGPVLIPLATAVLAVVVAKKAWSLATSAVTSAIDAGKSVWEAGVKTVGALQSAWSTAGTAATAAGNAVKAGASAVASTASAILEGAKNLAALASAWIRAGVEAALSAAKQAAAWVATQAQMLASAVADGAVWLATKIGHFAAVTASAVTAGAVTSAAWLVEQAKMLASAVADGAIWLATKIGHFAAATAAAVAEAAAMSGAWLLAQAVMLADLAAGGAAWLAMRIAQFSAASASAIAEGAASAVAWVAAQSAMTVDAAVNGAAWLARTIANFVAVSASALAEGVMTAARWVAAQTAMTVDSVVNGTIWLAGMIARFIAISASAVAEAAVTTAAWIAAGVAENLATGGMIIALGLLVAAGVFLITHWGDVKRIAGEVWDWIVQKFKDGVNFVIDIVNGFADAINTVAKALGFDINLHVNRLDTGGPVDPVPAPRADGGIIEYQQVIRAAQGAPVTGQLPGYSPGYDTIPAMAGRQPYLLAGGEYIVRPESTRAIGPAGMAAINNAYRDPVQVERLAEGGRVPDGRYVVPQVTADNHSNFLDALAAGQPEAIQAAGSIGADPFRHFATGGQVQAGLDFAKAQAGKPYIWGGVGPDGFDCSGLLSAVTNTLRGVNPYQRLGVARSQPWSGFQSGLGGAWSTGFSTGHTAGTLDGINIESTSTPIRFPGGAGADSSQFSGHAFLPEVGGTFASGGGGGGGGIIAAIENFLSNLASSLLTPVRNALNAVGDKFGFPGKAAAGAFNKIIDSMFATAESKDAAGGDPGGAGGGSAVSGGGPNVDIVRRTAAQFGWDQGPEWNALNAVIMRESGYNNLAQNPTSSAYGIFQFLDSTWAAYGVQKTSDPVIQSIGGMRYVKARYQDPIGAQAHENSFGWYDQGGMLPVGLSTVLNTTGSPEPVLNPDQWSAILGKIRGGDGAEALPTRIAALLTTATERATSAGAGSGAIAEQVHAATQQANAAVTAAMGQVTDELSQVRELLQRRGAGATVNVTTAGDPTETARSTVLALRLT